MLTSIAIILLTAIMLGGIFKKLKLPGLLGMIITGVLLGPCVLNLIDGEIMEISSELRRIALVIILTRAGLSLNIKDLKKVGRPAFLMCFVPACFEIAAITFFAPKLLDVSTVESAVLGTVLAAVSPAVIVPGMIKLIDGGYGKERSIPQLILAGASVDDVFVIVLFTAFSSLASGGEINVKSFFDIPVSIVFGIITGIICGLLLIFIFKKIHMRDSVKMLIMLSASFLMLELENRLEGIVSVSGLLGIMTMGITILQKYDILARRISIKYNKLWVAAEIILFVLVGAGVDLSYVTKAGAGTVALIVLALLFRMAGVYACMLKTKITKKERLFCMLAYTPKATVQAAIGGIPLSMGLACGQTVLTAAVMSIIITAPFGAICIEKFSKKLLSHN